MTNKKSVKKFPLTIIAALLFASHANLVQADTPYDKYAPASFIDDFSDPMSTAISYNDWGPDSGESGVSYENKSVRLEASSDSTDDRQGTELHLYDVSNILSARLSLSSDTVQTDENSYASIQIHSLLANDTQDSASDLTGDLEFGLGLGKGRTGTPSVNFWAGRFDSNGGFTAIALNDAGANALSNITPALDTEYDVSIELDRTRGVVVLTFDGTSTEYTIGGDSFNATRHQHKVIVQSNGAQSNAVGHVHAISSDNKNIDFSQTVPTIGPYTPHWNARYSNNQLEHADGLLTLVADAQSGDVARRNLTLNTQRQTDYLSADLMLSQESVILADGFANAGIGADVFNTISENNTEVGDATAYLSITAQGSSAPIASYCIWEEITSGQWVDMIGGSTDHCLNEFTTPVTFDTSYPASVEFDRVNSRILFKLGDEEVEYDLTSGVYQTAYPDYFLRANTSIDSKAVAIFDNYQIGKDALPLAISPDQLLIDDGTAGDGGSSSGGGGGGLGLFSLSLGLIALFRRKRPVITAS